MKKSMRSMDEDPIHDIQTEGWSNILYFIIERKLIAKAWINSFEWEWIDSWIRFLFLLTTNRNAICTWPFSERISRLSCRRKIGYSANYISKFLNYWSICAKIYQFDFRRDPLYGEWFWNTFSSKSDANQQWFSSNALSIWIRIFI